MFISTVLTPEQRLLLLFQRKLLISEYNDFSSDEEENTTHKNFDEKLFEIRQKVLSKDPELF